MIPSDVFFWGSLVFIAGVTSASLGWSIYLLLLAVAALGIITRLSGLVLTSSQLVLLLILTGMGAWYFHLSENIKEQRTHIVIEEKITLSAIIRETPRLGEEYRTFKATLEPPYAGKILIVAQPLSDVAYGDYIEAEGVVLKPRSPHDLPAMIFPEISIKEHHRGFWLREKLFSLKERFVYGITRFLPGDEGALLAGITVGERTTMSAKFKEHMALSGTIHLVALSGYNIAILVSAIGRALRGRLSRSNNFLATGLFISLFVLMVGAEASIVRAAVMGILVLLAQELGRVYSPRNAIALAAVLMTLATPSAPAYDAGFQLSFASLIGIVYLAPIVHGVLRIKDDGAFGWKFNAITTFSAQCMVLPILLGSFGALPLLGVLANILILQLIPFTMFVGFLQGIAGMFFAYAGFAAAQLAHILVGFEVGVIEFFSRISVPLKLHMGFATASAYYALLLVGMYALAQRTPRHELLRNRT